MAIKGSLREASLADVCQLLALGLKTGCLSVTDRSRFGQIFFDNGRISFASVVNRRDRLGDLLVRDGLLDHGQLRSILAQQSRQPEKRLGELLVENGLITREQLDGYIRQQIEDALYHLFTWSQGSFYFEVDLRPEPGEMLVSINAESVLLEGARRVDEWGLIEKKIPSFDLIFEVDRKHLTSAGVELSAEQERIAPLLDGTRSVQQILDQTGLGEFEAGQALFGLISAGFARQVGRRASEPATRAREAAVAEHVNLGVAFYQTGMLEEAERELQKVLELQPDDFTTRFRLALIALRSGREREAIRLFKRLLEQRGPNYAVFVNLAVALRCLGRFADALLVLREAESLRAGTAEVALAQAQVHLESGDVAAADAALAEARTRLGGATPPARWYHGAVLAAAVAGRLEEAAGLAGEGVEAHPNSAPLLALAGAIAERRGDVAQAERLYRLAAGEDPSLPQSYKGLGDVAYRRGLHDEALENYRRVVSMAPDLGDDAYARLGNLHYKRHERDEAMECWERALELNPGNLVVRNNLEIIRHAAR